MKIAIWSIGKPNVNYIKQGVEDFSKRINNYFKLEWDIIAPPKNAGKMNMAELKKTEGEQIISRLQKDDFLVALDERGTQLKSEEFAALIQNTANASTKKMVFLIGGAFGIDEVVLKRANYKMSLSKLVFPHQLVRLIIAEQIYRACSILKNEKYHHQ